MFELKLTEQEVNIILAGLGELAAKHSIELILKVKNECEAQIAKEALPKVDEGNVTAPKIAKSNETIPN